MRTVVVLMRAVVHPVNLPFSSREQDQHVPWDSYLQDLLHEAHRCEGHKGGLWRTERSPISHLPLVDCGAHPSSCAGG